MLKAQLSQMLKLPENQVRVIAPDVGGGFGSKLNVYAEEALLGYLALKLNRPVKWSEERRENFQATIHGRGQAGEVEAAVKEKNPDVKMQFEHAAPAFRTPMDGPLPGLLKQAVKFAFERDAVFVRDGGTIGAMTDWTAREMELDFAFLPEGNFQMEAYQDGVNANRHGGDYQKVASQIKRTHKLKIKLAEGGGWAARISPAR